MSNIVCIACHRSFTTDRGLQLHWGHSKKCYDIAVMNHTACSVIKTIINTDADVKIEDTSALENDYFEEDALSCDSPPLENLPDDYDVSLLDIAKDYVMSKNQDTIEDMDVYKAQVRLLEMLKDNNSPLYMFDQIMQWAIQCNSDMNIMFNRTNVLSRNSFVGKLKTQFDVNKIDHYTKIIKLPGSLTETKIVCHDFKMCLYSLLNDKKLMVEDNLLLNKENIFLPPPADQTNTIDDIHTGSVYRKAYKTYIKNADKEILCPIIFFIDKTHTDRNGRLCLEQVRFTLGIFNKETRNSANAWRTLGYINDQAQIPTSKSTDKVNDYQEMIRVILGSFRESQKSAIGWKLKFGFQEYDVFFRVPVLFIIGDTDGHDKLCGRYGSRQNVARLCRYCDTAFDETDNPFIKYSYTEQNKITSLICKNKCDELSKISMHCIKNAWHEVDWCDQKRGVHGGTCAEVMHCLQHGLFLYCLNQLFGQRKEKKNKPNKTHNRKRAKSNNSNTETNNSDESENGEGDDCFLPEASENYSRNKVFSQVYCKHFDKCARTYGKLLSRQSDRDLPRTYFNTNYTSATLKNASEMSGVLIVFLVIFASKEGNYIDEQLGSDRASAFMHVLELMLLLETFCKAPSNKKHEVVLLKQFMPRLLETFKTTINRTEGNGMKIIKFHLPLHFADDVLRFGVMSNFDSAMGESHHKSEAKKPALRTQRRKNEFEEQTAKRQIENISIRIANDYINEPKPFKNRKEQENKCFCIEYVHEHGKLFFRDRKRKLHELKWEDQVFQKHLTSECSYAVMEGFLVSPIRFFTQHNRQGIIFHANPSYKDNVAWYDWAYINWGDARHVPSKMMLFLCIERCEFKKPFKFGHGTIASHGDFAIGHTFAFDEVVQAHGITKLFDYGKLLTYHHPELNIVPQLWVFEVDSIVCPCTAIPYDNYTDPVNELEWIILKPKNEWYQIFIYLMEKAINNRV